MPTASIKFTADFLVVALQRYRRQHRGRYVVLAIKLVGLATFLPLAVFAFWQGHRLIGVFLTAVSVFMFFAHHVDYWLARRSFRRSPYRDEDVVIELTDAGFQARSQKQNVQLQWAVFTKVAHFRDGFLLFQGPKVFNWIPLSSLSDPSQASELAALLRAKIPEHRIVEPIAAPNGDAAAQPGSSDMVHEPPSVR